MKKHQSKIFDTTTVQGIKAAERFKMKMENAYQSVNVYAIGLNRVQIVALKAIGRTASEYGNDEIRWPDGLQHY